MRELCSAKSMRRDAFFDDFFEITNCDADLVESSILSNLVMIEQFEECFKLSTHCFLI